VGRPGERAGEPGFLLSLKEVRMVEVAITEKQYRVVPEPDKVATAVFRLLGMSSPRHGTEVDAPPKSEEAAPA
jgi:hypothetical protein